MSEPDNLQSAVYRGGRLGHKTQKVSGVSLEQLANASADRPRATGRAGGKTPRAIGPHDGPSGGAAAAAPPEITGTGACTRFATFMFKGGVYKTMTTVHAASALAGPGYKKKVLIVDADSQCNATSFFQPEPQDWKAEQEQEQAQEGSASEGAVQAGASSRIKLSQPNASCPKSDPLTKSFLKMIPGSGAKMAKNSRPFMICSSPNLTRGGLRQTTALSLYL